MIEITRVLARQLRAVIRRALRVTNRGAGPGVLFAAGPQGLCIRAKSAETAVEYVEPGAFPQASIVLPLAALKDCEGGRANAVTLLPGAEGKVSTSWTEKRVPQLRSYDVSAEQVFTDFPAAPTEWTANRGELLRTLQLASLVADDMQSARYALHCIQLEGMGRVTATDGRQLFRTAGFTFPWTGDLLIDRNTVFGLPELGSYETIRIGKTDDWVAIQAGPWTLHSKIDKTGRFPKHECLMPAQSTAVAGLSLSPGDARFLVETIPGLPADDPIYLPITLDLNGRIAIRARAAENASPTEIVLSNSVRTGAPLRLNMNRTFLRRAIQMGFHEVRCFGSDRPMLCDDGVRQYLWMLLESKDAIPPSNDATRVVSPLETDSQPLTTDYPRSHVPMATQQPASQEPAVQPTPDRKRPVRGAPPSVTGPGPIERAIALKASLRDSLTKTNELIVALKLQKKKSRLMQTTLASLRELQSVAG